MMDQPRVNLGGTHRLFQPERVRTAPVRNYQEITVTVTLRGKDDSNLRPLQVLAGVPVKQRKHLTVEQAIRAFSHAPKDELAIHRFAREYNLTWSKSNTEAATMQLRGTVRQLNRAFGVKLYHYSESNYDSKYYAHEEEVTLPEYLTGVVTGVFGLDRRPTGRRPGLSHRMSALGIAPPPVTGKTRRPVEFAPLYNFPSAALGKGQAIGLLEFGGGFRRRELNAYFASLPGH
jgi:kumamolisin